MSVTKSKSSTALFLESLNDNPRDNHCFRENPGHYNHEEPKVKWAYIHRASKIFWFLLSLWDSFWRLFWGVNVYLHFTKIKIKYVYFSMDTYTCRHIHTLRYFFPQISGSKNLYMNQHHVQGLLKQEFLGLSPWVSLPVGLGCVRPCVCVCVCACVPVHARAQSYLTLWLYVLEPARLLCQWNFPGKKHCSVSPLPPPGDLPNPVIKRQISFVSCFGRRILYYCATWEAHRSGWGCRITCNSLQLMLLLLVPGPHGENYCPQERDKMDVPSESIWHSIIGHIRLKWLLNKCVILNAFFTQPADI